MARPEGPAALAPGRRALAAWVASIGTIYRASGAPAPATKRGTPPRGGRRIRRYLPELFTFVRDPRVPPTNNAAERSIRPLVIARKISGGPLRGRELHAHGARLRARHRAQAPGPRSPRRLSAPPPRSPTPVTLWLTECEQLQDHRQLDTAPEASMLRLAASTGSGWHAGGRKGDGHPEASRFWCSRVRCTRRPERHRKPPVASGAPDAADSGT